MEDLAQAAIDAALKIGVSFVDVRIENSTTTIIEINDGKLRNFNITDKPSMLNWVNPDDWKIFLPTKSGNNEIIRKSNALTIRNMQKNRKFYLLKQKNIKGEKEKIINSYKNVSKKYLIFKDYYEYRLTAIRRIFLLFIVILFILLPLKLISFRYLILYKLSIIILWISLFVYLNLIYFNN